MTSVEPNPPNDIQDKTLSANVPGDIKMEKEMSEIERAMSQEDIKGSQNYARMDKEIAKYATGEAVFVSDTESRRLKKLIDRRVLVIMVITYFLQALDKGTMSFTSIMGINEDLDLDRDQRFSWLTTCIYIAILIVEYPINWTIQRVPVAKFLGSCVVIWGAVLALHSTAGHFRDLLAMRTLLGIFEAVCQPTFLILSSMWYKREEQAAIVTYWYMMNGAQQIVGGLLAYCFSLMPENAAITGYQGIFITYGAASVLWGLFVIFWLPDSPMRAKCFSEEDKKLMIERVRSNQTGLQNKKFRKEQAWEVLKDPQTYCYCLIQICTTLPTSGLGAFANRVIKGFGFTTLETQLLAMVLGAYIIIVLFGSAWLTKRYNQNLLVMGLFVIPSYVGTIVIMSVVNDEKTSTEAGLLISYYITLSFWAAQGLGMSLLTRNVAGQTKKSFAVTLNFVCWSAGNAIGPMVFLEKEKPRFFTAFAVHIGCYVLLTFVIIFLRWYLKRENRKRDAAAAAGAHEAMDERNTHAFEDLTDKENPNFRYVY